MPDTKACTKCGEEKPLDGFYRKSCDKSGYRPHCKTCDAADTRRYRAENPDRHRERERRYKAENPDVARRGHLKRKFGLTVAEWEAMWNEQKGQCAACQRELVRARAGGVATDHCHSTGAVRGLLCSQCNFALGLLKDDPNRCRDLARYIEEHTAVPA